MLANLRTISRRMYSVAAFVVGGPFFGFTGYDHRFFKRIFIDINYDSDGGKVRKTMKMFPLQSFFLHLS